MAPRATIMSADHVDGDIVPPEVTPPSSDEPPRKRRQAASRALENIADIHKWEQASESSRIVRRVAAALNEQFSVEASRRRNKGARNLVTPLDRQQLRGTCEGQNEYATQ
eukprot:2652229-Rhodomonas_salina.1